MRYKIYKEIARVVPDGNKVVIEYCYRVYTEIDAEDILLEISAREDK
jgi:hypothetical protein